MEHKLNGIQQIGVGVPNVIEAWEWFNKNFGMDVKIFDEEAVAKYMLPHTGGKPRERRAILAMNMQGGGGLEIWQHTGKEPEMPSFEIRVGDLGISVCKMKTPSVQKAYDDFKAKGLDIITPVVKNPAGVEHFFVKDLYGNVWEFVHEDWVFGKGNGINGGTYGAIIGVKDVEDSLRVYRDILGYEKVVYDKEGVFEDFAGVPGGENRFRRVLLSKPMRDDIGGFGPLLGPSQLELVQVLDREPKTIFEGRIWGDPGFIQVCYDIVNMNALREFVKSKGFPFTVDSSNAIDNFDMGEASGNFSYIQCPEGTLIEFVETTRVPIVKKLGIVVDLRKKGGDKPLPRWILKMLSLKRVKV